MTHQLWKLQMNINWLWFRQGTGCLGPLMAHHYYRGPRRFITARKQMELYYE